MLHNLTILKNNSEVANRLVVARSEGGWAKMSGGVQKVQTPRQITDIWACNVQHGHYT